MKILKNIFLLVFLGGMLFTVFNFLPLIEEEASSKKIELSKTSKSDNDGPGSEDDADPEAEGLVHPHPASFLKESSAANDLTAYLQRRYLPPSPQRCTPPPRF